MDRNDTIAAMATAPGKAGIAVVRVSGPDAFAVAERLVGFRPQPGRFRLAKVRGNGRLPGASIDMALVLAFAKPRSYTGEDVVEFQCHGGSVTPRRVLEACFTAGARLARRGEFTERAFLNGKLDYEQAESVLALINAKTERAADDALEGLEGRGHREARELYDFALNVSSTLEHSLDVSEEELPNGFLESVSEMMSQLDNRLGEAVVRLKQGKLLREGALVVLAGPPNAGKSSLMNALLGENRAIVSERPGTTRDSIEEWLDVGGYPVRLVDTAGMRKADDEVEAEGVRRTEALVSKADIVLRLTPADGIGTELPPEVANAPGGVIEVLAKSDLLAEGSAKGGIAVSAKTGFGLDHLRQEIASRLERTAASCEKEHCEGENAISALLEARETLRPLVLASCTPSPDLVLSANAVRNVATKLGELTGATYSDDLLDRLFSRFCVGK